MTEIERLRALARLEELPDPEVLVEMVEGDRRLALEWLILCWPPERGVVPQEVVRGVVVKTITDPEVFGEMLCMLLATESAGPTDSARVSPTSS